MSIPYSHLENAGIEEVEYVNARRRTIFKVLHLKERGLGEHITSAEFVGSIFNLYMQGSRCLGAAAVVAYLMNLRLRPLPFPLSWFRWEKGWDNSFGRLCLSLEVGINLLMTRNFLF